ncbi:MAG: hypothetical protein U9N57_03150 [Pseudomonadota bacterium]|nr:hypothetical protein [Pseudomonadota bacterium]
MSNISEFKNKSITFNHHDLEIKFNERVWHIVNHFEDKEELLFSIYDPNDGTTFIINTEFLEDSELLTNSDIEAFLFKDLFNKDNRLKVVKKSDYKVNNSIFNTVNYMFNNKKFGKQNFMHFYMKKGSYLYLIACAWPYEIKPEAEKILPGKLHILFHGIQGSIFK